MEKKARLVASVLMLSIVCFTVGYKCGQIHATHSVAGKLK